MLLQGTGFTKPQATESPWKKPQEPVPQEPSQLLHSSWHFLSALAYNLTCRACENNAQVLPLERERASVQTQVGIANDECPLVQVEYSKEMRQLMLQPQHQLFTAKNLSQ